MTTIPSTTIITNLKNLTTSTANTLGSANAGGFGMAGMLALALLKASELKVCLTLIAARTDSLDPNLITLNDILASLT